MIGMRLSIPWLPDMLAEILFHYPQQLINALDEFFSLLEIFLHWILIQPIENWIGWAKKKSL